MTEKYRCRRGSNICNALTETKTRYKSDDLIEHLFFIFREKLSRENELFQEFLNLETGFIEQAQKCPCLES